METTATSKVSHLVHKYSVFKLSEKQDIYLSSLIAACNNVWMSHPKHLPVHNTIKGLESSKFVGCVSRKTRPS